MRYLVKVQVDLEKMREFGIRLKNNELDRKLVKSDTFCYRDKPEIGFSIWESTSKEEFEAIFEKWKPYYSSVEIIELITASESMIELGKRIS